MFLVFEEFKRKFITCSTDKLACSHCVSIRQDARFPIFQKPIYWHVICAVSATIPRKASFRRMTSEGEARQIIKKHRIYTLSVVNWNNMQRFYGTSLRNKTNNQMKAGTIKTIKDLFKRHVQCRWFKGFTIAHYHYGCRWLIKELDFVF